MMSVTATVAVAIGASRLVPGPMGWLSTAFATTSVYLVLSGLEMALARMSQERREDAPEEPTDPP